MNRTVGAAAGSTLALALLVCGCVFTALTGPAVSLHTRTQALHQTLAALPTTSRAIRVNADWGEFIQDLRYAAQYQSGPAVDQVTFAESARDIAGGLAASHVPLAGGNWAGLGTNAFGVTSGAAASAYAGKPPQMEVFYRDPFTSQARLVSGSYASRPAPAGTVSVAATTQNAARFGLHPGSRLTLRTPQRTVTLLVTAIVAERAPASAFWTEDSTAARPVLLNANSTIAPPYWVGAVIADPGQYTAMLNAFGDVGMELSWEFPLAVRGVNADQVQGLYDVLNHATSVTPTLAGALAPGVDALTVSSPLLRDLSQFLATQAAITTVLLLLLVSLTVVGAAVILLAARMIAGRRAGELAMIRARGGSLRQVAAVVARGALVAAAPAALLGAGLAIAVIPGDGWGGQSRTAAAWLAGLTLAAALAGPPLIAAWQHRRPAPASNPARITGAETGRPRRAWRRPVAEVTAIAACVAGLVVLRNQGTSGGTDLYLSVTPVLVAIPVVLIMLRLYPLAVRGLLAASARRSGATGFVALSRAARSSLTGVLPAFGLVLALAVGTFAGMVSQGITRGEVAASWQAAGADAVITAGQASPPVSPAALRAISAVRGVHRAAAVWNTSWDTQFGQQITVTAVDPAGYSALVADTPFPPLPPIGARVSRGAAVPVLASPSAAAILGGGATQLTSIAPNGQFTVRVAGTLSGTPAQPAGAAFAVVPLQALASLFGRPEPNMVLVTGSAIDQARLSAVADRFIPASSVLFRSAVLAELSRSPLQHGAALLTTLTVAASAAFGLFIVMLGLALGSAERELTLARLAVMGHERATWLVMTEALPAVIAAIAAGAGCAVALPRVIGSSVDLSVFTGSGTPVRFQADAAALGLPAAAIAVLAVAVLAAQASALSRRSVTALLRIGGTS